MKPGPVYGKPTKEKPPRCAGHTLSEGPWNVQCTRTTNLKQEDGKLWCWQHLPSAVKKRAKQRHAKRDAERKADDRRWALQNRRDNATDALVNLCRRLVAGENVTAEIEKKLKTIDQAEKSLDRANVDK